LTNLQAAIGCAQVERAEELIGGRRQICAWYGRELGDVRGVVVNRASPWATPTCWLACAEFDGLDEHRREQLMHRLKQRGVDTRPYFFLMSDIPYFEAADTPAAHAASVRGLNPRGPTSPLLQAPCARNGRPDAILSCLIFARLPGSKQWKKTVEGASC
jgi:perosamine synthetase